MGQSRISTQLSQLKAAGLVTDERSGKNNMYSCTAATDLMEVAQLAAEEVAEVAADQTALRHLLSEAQGQRARLFRRTGRPLRQGLRARPVVEGAGRGAASRCSITRWSPTSGPAKAPGPTPRATRREGHRGGSVTENGRVRPRPRPPERPGQSGIPPRRHRRPADRRGTRWIWPSSARPCTTREHPQRAIDAAFRILKPGGRLIVLDLLQHHFEEARELYADRWLGFSESDLAAMLEKAGFHQHRDARRRPRKLRPELPDAARHRHPAVTTVRPQRGGALSMRAQKSAPKVFSKFRRSGILRASHGPPIGCGLIEAAPPYFASRVLTSAITAKASAM